jgi:hypothetical protein
MNHGTYIFTEIAEYIPRSPLLTSIASHNGEHYVKEFSCRDQLLALMYGQLAYRESLRDLVLCLHTHREKLYHMGFRTEPKLPTLAKANEKRSWKIYRDLCIALIAEARPLYADEPAIAADIVGSVYAIDSSSIEICLALIPSLAYVPTKGAVKLHLGLDIRGSIPAFFDMTAGNVHDTKFLDSVVFEAGSFYILDRGYLDFVRLYAIHTAGSFFVTRAKVNTKFTRRYSRKTGETITSDHVGTIDTGKYPDTLRRIRYTDADGRRYIFLTNNMTVSAESIALLYKNRWQIELFFKWIKQHLKIKCFWGHSENAVKLQICVALATYLIVAIMKKKLKLSHSLYEILQILSISLFEKNSLTELFSEKIETAKIRSPERTALLFDF